MHLKTERATPQNDYDTHTAETQYPPAPPENDNLCESLDKPASWRVTHQLQRTQHDRPLNCAHTKRQEVHQPPLLSHSNRRVRWC